ncbi:pyocin S6 family toxin immunity protein [Pseudomonas sp. SZMC_28357]|uniref:pyocin S6 family toxin immunity protein n=1 Tax=Pseudomonas sp. SZMC_28357 TaxID=3074380 RepID=UPI002872304E|nr:pyocin S6 family toxin immunity protein [Pseudomonas sp. SZMC_28357]MDR9754850.1 pyocin S6 family toxin immunity protein [Pseudomonas sp. SZMC_28357]
MRYLSITGFHPDEKQDDSLQFELTITDPEMNQALAQLTESKALEDIQPGELELTTEQIREIAGILNVHFPSELEYFIGTRRAP